MAGSRQRQGRISVYAPVRPKRRSRRRERLPGSEEMDALPAGFDLAGALELLAHPDRQGAQRQGAAQMLGEVLGNRRLTSLVRQDGGKEEAEKLLVRMGGRLPPVVGEPLKKEGIDDERVPGLRVRADLGVDAHTRQENPRRRGGRRDTIYGAFEFESGIQETLEPGSEAFGEEQATIGIDQVSWGQEGGEIVIEGRVYTDCEWGVQSLGNTDIPNAEASAVNAQTWAKIVADLTPDEDGIPIREKYWARDLTARHEQFHAKDDIQQVEKSLPAAKAWLESQQVPRRGTAESVVRLLSNMRDNIQGEVEQHYEDGGEERAYGDGKPHYQARAQAVAARAAREGWGR